jgi:hypothetical protein
MLLSGKLSWNIIGSLPSCFSNISSTCTNHMDISPLLVSVVDDDPATRLSIGEFLEIHRGARSSAHPRSRRSCASSILGGRLMFGPSVGIAPSQPFDRGMTTCWSTR